MHRDEERAIETLSRCFPKRVGPYVYRELLTETFNRSSVESQVVTYADKLDAYCEGMHEILAGNITLLQCILFYPHILGMFDRKFPALKPFLEDKTSVLTDLERFLDAPFVKSSDYAKFGKPFTKTSIILPSVFPFYDRWRELIMEKGGAEGVRTLIGQKEFLQRQTKKSDFF